MRGTGENRELERPGVTAGTTKQPPKVFEGGCAMLFGVPFLGAGLTVMCLSIFGKLGNDVGIGLRIVMFLFSLPFTLIGGAIIYGGLATLTGRLLISRRPRARRSADNAQPARGVEDHPNFPRRRKLVHGPRGGIVLHEGAFQNAGVVVMFFFAAIWNGFSWTVTWHLWRDREGWFPMLILSLFDLVGILLICLFVYTVLRAVLTGAPIVEVAMDPVKPGRRIRAYITMRRTLRITKMSVHLECREKATHGSGSNSTRYTETVHDETLIEKEGLQAVPGKPVLDFEFAVPPDAMHSFHATDNSIVWGLRVKMDIPGKPDVDDFLEVRVAPAG